MTKGTIRSCAPLGAILLLLGAGSVMAYPATEPISYPIESGAGPYEAYIDTTAFLPSPTPERPGSGLELRPGARPRPQMIADPFPYFVFAVIGDSHIVKGSGADLRFLKACDRSRDLLATYVKDINNHDPRVNFAIHVGDITDLGAADQFVSAGRALDSLNCPLYPVVGNHDNFKSDAKAGWLAFARRQSTNYSFDMLNLHFIVIDCTLDPYAAPYVDCDSTLRDWVAGDLAENHCKPTIILSHFNMWERPWNPMFDTTLCYAEYRGMPELRRVLEDADNVIAVINGHVHANRVEQHNGIYYVDVGATLVGPPSIRYFYVYQDRIEVRHEDLSDAVLASVVTGLCARCCCCFDSEEVCSFVDGTLSDKDFTIPISSLAGTAEFPGARAGAISLEVANAGVSGASATISSDITGTLEISLHDVRGRRLDRCNVPKEEKVVVIDLARNLHTFQRLPAGIYFLRAAISGASATDKIALVR